MSQKSDCAIAVIGIDIGKNSFHVVGHDQRGAIVLRQKWSRARRVRTSAAGNLPQGRVYVGLGTWSGQRLAWPAMQTGEQNAQDEYGHDRPTGFVQLAQDARQQNPDDQEHGAQVAEVPSKGPVMAEFPPMLVQNESPFNK
jgi:hypothetical protein